MRKNGWPQIAIDFVAKNAALITDEEMAKQLSLILGKTITRTSCTYHRNKLKLSKTRGPKSKLTGGQSKPVEVTTPDDTVALTEVTEEKQENHNVSHGQF